MEKLKENKNEINGYPIIKILRENDRHFTYLSNKGEEKVVVKVYKGTDDNKHFFKEEIERVKNERGKIISAPELIEEGDNYFITKYYEKSINEYLDEIKDDDEKKAALFNDILEGTREIEHKQE